MSSDRDGRAAAGKAREGKGSRLRLFLCREYSREMAYLAAMPTAHSSVHIKYNNSESPLIKPLDESLTPDRNALPIIHGLHWLRNVHRVLRDATRRTFSQKGENSPWTRGSRVICSDWGSHLRHRDCAFEEVLRQLPDYVHEMTKCRFCPFRYDYAGLADKEVLRRRNCSCIFFPGERE